MCSKLLSFLVSVLLCRNVLLCFWATVSALVVRNYDDDDDDDDDNVDVNILRMMAYWYANQQLCIKWLSTFSRLFTITNGTRQGGILSPYP